MSVTTQKIPICSICTVNDADFHKRIVNPSTMEADVDHFCMFCAIVTGFVSYADAKEMGHGGKIQVQRKNILEKAEASMKKAISEECYEEAAKLRDIVGMVKAAEKTQEEEDVQCRH